MPMMHVLHVSFYSDPSSVTRVVVGCEDLAAQLALKLQAFDYCVWESYEEDPERSDEEKAAAQELLRQTLN